MDEAPERPGPRGPRSYLLLIDGYNNLSMLRFSRMRQAAGDWIRRTLRAGDEAAVAAMTPFFGLVTDFTDDPNRLRDVIADVRVFPASDLGSDFMREKLQSGSAGRGGALEGQLLNAATVGNDLLSLERDQFYRNLSEAAEWLRPRGGSRAIILLSGGFPLTRGRGSMATGGLTPRFREALGGIQDAGIRVYAFDVGEEAGFTDTAAAVNTRQMVDALGLGTEWLDRMQIGAESDTVTAHQQILAVLGRESGGRFIAGHDYATGLRMMEDDQSHYYLLGYEPADRESQAGRYLPLVVGLRDERLRVIARGGRFTRPARPPLAIACHPHFYPLDDTNTLVVLTVSAHDPALEPTAERAEAPLEMDLTIGAAIDGDEVARSRRNIRTRSPQRAAGAPDAGFQVRDALVLPAGKARVSIDLRLKDAQRSGTWEGTLVVPHRDHNRFGLTDLVLLDPTESEPVLFDVFRAREEIGGPAPHGSIADPLGPDDGRRPPACTGGPFPRESRLLVQAGVVRPPAPSAAFPNPLRLDWELLPATGGGPLAPPIRYRRLHVRESENLLDVVADVDLHGVPPGDYTFMLSAGNLLTGEKDSRSAPLTLAP